MSSTKVFASDNVVIYTPYTEISAPPGKTITYSVQVINHSNTVQNLPVYITGLPRNWNYNFQMGAWPLKRVAILPNKKQILQLHVKVPLKINKGHYHFKIHAGLDHLLPLTVIISKKGTYKTSLTAKQYNMEGLASSSYQFNATLSNFTADKQLYSLRSESPLGWNVTFMYHFKDATSVSVKPNTKVELEIKVKPPDNVRAGTYKIPVEVTTGNTSARMNLEVVITGTYKMILTTPTGRVSTNITSGKQKRLELIVRNTGSAVLNNIKPSYEAPANWKVTFEPKIISSIQPGHYVRLFATIKSNDKAIAGDYMTKISAITPEVSSHVSFRVSVKTPMLWGWIGVLIILFALGLVYYLFRKYGRR